MRLRANVSVRMCAHACVCARVCVRMRVWVFYPLPVIESAPLPPLPKPPSPPPHTHLLHLAPKCDAKLAQQTAPPLSLQSAACQHALDPIPSLPRLQRCLLHQRSHMLGGRAHQLGLHPACTCTAQSQLGLHPACTYLGHRDSGGGRQARAGSKAGGRQAREGARWAGSGRLGVRGR